MVALACISAGAVAWAAALWLGRSASARAGRGDRHLTPAHARILSLGTVALAVAAFVLGLFPPPT